MMKLEALVPALNMGTPKVIRNNAGGIFNHLIFFKVGRPSYKCALHLHETCHSIRALPGHCTVLPLHVA